MQLTDDDLETIDQLLKNWSIKSREIEDLEWAEQAFMKFKYQPFTVAYSHKYNILINGIIDEAVRVGDKVLVFSQSIPGLDLLELYLSRRDVRHPCSS